MRTRPQGPRSDRFGAVKDAAITQIKTLARELLPQGRCERNRWVSRVPWRDDKKPSLHVYYNTARFQDFGEGDGGTIVDLVMRLDACDQMRALETLEGLLGIDRSKPRPARPAVPKCPQCAHCWRRYSDEHAADLRYCTLVTLEGEPVPTRLARRSGWGCGPTGKMFKAQVSGN